MWRRPPGTAPGTAAMVGQCWPLSFPRQSGRMTNRSTTTQSRGLRADARIAASARLAHPQQSPTQQQFSHPSTPRRHPYSSRQASGKYANSDLHKRQFRSRNTAAASAWCTHLRHQMTQRGRRPGAAKRQLCITAGIASTFAPTHVTSHVWNGSQALAQTLVSFQVLRIHFQATGPLLQLRRVTVDRNYLVQ